MATKATLQLTIPRSFKSSAKDLSSQIFEIIIRGHTTTDFPVADKPACYDSAPKRIRIRLIYGKVKIVAF